MFALMVLLAAMPQNLAVLSVPVIEATTAPQEVWIEKLHQCENPDNVPWIIDSNGKRSYGYVMFQMDTFLSYGKDYGATRQNISSSTVQKRVAQAMLDGGLWRHWYTCAKAVSSSLGAYPVPQPASL